ncbi:KTSC domain-containing protein [Xanthomonas citri pv. bilvae]|uniref:KTSC domain-containing protein n=1 Tax=Xanthomonas citri TaxID=346 RepID=UPI0030C87AFD
MKIQFVQGHTYDFCGVPSHVFQGLLNAAQKEVTTTIISVTAISVNCLALGRGLAINSHRDGIASRLNSSVRHRRGIYADVGRIKFRQAWGDKPCDHSYIEKEYRLGSKTGEYVCTQCGEEKEGLDWNRKVSDASGA